MLIAVEGVHGSGKSTFITTLSDILTRRGFNVITTSWNSYPLLKDGYRYLRTNGLLTDSLLYFMMQLSDFTCRYEHIILPGLKNKSIIIADRYTKTGIIRGIARGLDEKYVRSAYSFAQIPNITIFIDVPAECSIKRRVPKSNMVWRIGMGNVGVNEDFDSSGYLSYIKQMCQLYYAENVNDKSVISIDGTLSKEEMINRFFQIKHDFIKMLKE